MNREQQAARIEKIVATIAERVVTVPLITAPPTSRMRLRRCGKPSCRPMRLMRG